MCARTGNKFPATARIGVVVPTTSKAGATNWCNKVSMYTRSVVGDCLGDSRQWFLLDAKEVGTSLYKNIYE